MIEIESEGRRLARVAVHLPVLQEWITSGNVIGPALCIEGLPAGARFVGSTFDSQQLVAFLFFAHPTFAQVRPGGLVPLLPVTHRRFAELVGNGNGGADRSELGLGVPGGGDAD